MMIPFESETDLRSCFCGAAIYHILTFHHPELKKKLGLDIKLLESYINRCRHYQGGFGSETNFESHAGLSYCAVGALKMLELPIEDQDSLKEFLVLR